MQKKRMVRRFDARFDDETGLRLARLCRKNHMSKSQLVRLLILNAPDRIAIIPLPVPIPN